MYSRKYNNISNKIKTAYCQIGGFMLQSERCKKNHAYRFLTGAAQGAGGEGVNRIDACAAEKI